MRRPTCSITLLLQEDPADELRDTSRGTPPGALLGGRRNSDP